MSPKTKKLAARICPSQMDFRLGFNENDDAGSTGKERHKNHTRAIRQPRAEILHFIQL